jgi:hypothetical protein
MKNPAASGRGIETDLLAKLAPHYNLKISPQGDGEFTPTRLKVMLILLILENKKIGRHNIVIVGNN